MINVAVIIVLTFQSSVGAVTQIRDMITERVDAESYFALQ